MKRARNLLERVEEYRYYSSSVGDVRPLPLNVLAGRLTAFYEVVKKASKATKKTGGSHTNPRLGRRLTR